MSWPVILIVTGVLVTVAAWAAFVYIAVRGLKTEIPDSRFGPLLERQETDQPEAMKVLLPVDGSAPSVAAVREVGRCRLPPGSSIEVLYVIHSRLPVIPDFPPWAVTIAAAHGESIRAQTRHAPGVLAAAEQHLQAHQPEARITTRIVEGVPKEEIVREARSLGADRIVLGSHGRGRAGRAILGSTAAGVAADAPCTVQIVRPRQAAQAVAGATAA
jgi:nucleotide-binding universal stress UspA family protein